MAKVAKKSATSRKAKSTQSKEAVSIEGALPVVTATSNLSPREQAKALLAQKTSEAKWQALYAKAKQVSAASYNMKNKYEKQTAITHKTLGWGFITDIKNGRLEVLFKDGIKYLISNYK